MFHLRVLIYLLPGVLQLLPIALIVDLFFTQMIGSQMKGKGMIHVVVYLLSRYNRLAFVKGLF